MTVKELCDKLDLKVFYMEEEDREIEGAYCGDLLSWVMGKCPADTACTILSEGVTPDDELLERAEKQGVTLLGSDLDEYQLCWKLKEALG